MIVRARLIKRKTDDGLMEVSDDIPLGQEYYVDYNTIQMVDCVYIATGQKHEKEMVQVYPHGYKWLPTELLEMLGAP